MSPARAAAAARLAIAAGAWAVLVGCVPLFAPRLSVLRWSPAVERPPDPSAIETWVEFSAAVDPTRAEEAFSLSEDGVRLEGRFAWEGNRLRFEALRAPHPGHRYLMAVTTGAESPAGLSLEREFQFAFSTRAEETRPAVRAITPADGGTIDDRFSPVTCTFSEPVDRASFLEAFSIVPGACGSFSWSPDGSICTWTPAEPLEWQTDYTVRVAGSLADLAGNLLGDEEVSRFHVGSDAAPPTVLTVRSTSGSVTLACADPAAPGPAAHGWEADWGIEVSFSEPVLREGLEEMVRVEPAWNFEIEDTARSCDRLVLEPRERLARDTLYRLVIRRGIRDLQGNASVADVCCLFVTDGPRSAPPSIARLRFCVKPSDPSAADAFREYSPTDVDQPLPLALGEFPVEAATPGMLDLYFHLAPGATPSLLSLMESLWIRSTNSCAAIAIVGIRCAGIGGPPPVEIDGAVAVRAYLSVVNTSASGLVTVGLRAGLVDSLGNPLARDWELPLLK